jgi:alginate O-acetyltransferase complex protein AlgJ
MKNWNSLFFGIFFVLFISTPSLVMLTSDLQGVSQSENRRLAKFPTFQPTREFMRTFPANFEAFYNDHFGLRNVFVRLYNEILVLGFKTSPKFLAEVGKGDWLFFAGDSELADLTGYYRHSPETLRKWKQTLEDRKNWLAARGIHYLLVVPPNKSMVYPEFLPDRIIKRKRTNNLDRLHDALAAAPTFKEVVDLRQVLLAAKNKELVYHKSDTHWNLAGSYAAYSAIITHLSREFPELTPVPRQMMEEKTGTLQGGDLSSVLSLRDKYYEPNPEISPPPGIKSGPWRPVEFVAMKDTPRQGFRTGRILLGGTEGKKLTTMVLADSFGSALMDFLAVHFKKIYKVNGARCEDLTEMILREKPDVIIDVSGARRMQTAMEESVEVRDEMIEHQIANSSPTLNVTAENLAAHLTSIADLQIDQQSNNGVVLRATGGDPQIRLSAESRLSTDIVSIKCVIDSPAATDFAFYYRNAEDKEYSEKKVYVAKLVRGENTILFRLYTPIRLDSLRIDPGTATGRYILKQFTLVESPRE